MYPNGVGNLQALATPICCSVLHVAVISAIEKMRIGFNVSSGSSSVVWTMSPIPTPNVTQKSRIQAP